MESLWPANLLSDGPALQAKEQINRLLEDQVLGIPIATGGRVQAELRRRDMPIGTSQSIFMFPANQPAKAYEFAVFRSPSIDFPIAIEVFHLKERVFQVRDLEELRKAVRRILGHAETSRIVRTLADESNIVGTTRETVIRDAGNSGVAVGGDSPMPRSILIGRVMRTQSGAHAMVSLFGVSGFLGEADISRLASKKIAAPLVVPLNDKFVLTLKFIDTVKLTLTSDELKVLQFEAQKALQ